MVMQMSEENYGELSYKCGGSPGNGGLMTGRGGNDLVFNSRSDN